MVQKTSNRQLRVAEEVRRVIAGAIEHDKMRSPELNDAIITVTEVVMSPDLKYATVYLMTLNGKNLGPVLEQLTADKWVFKKLIADRLKLRYTPDITFRADSSFENAEKIERLMRDPKVAADLAKKDDKEEEE